QHDTKHRGTPFRRRARRAGFADMPVPALSQKRAVRSRPGAIDMPAIVLTSHRMSNLRLIALDDTVVFPGMTVTLPIDVGEEKRVLLVPRHGTDYARVGTVADVSERVRLPGRGFAAVVAGLHRGVAGAARPDTSGGLRVEVQEVVDETPAKSRIVDREREYRAV